MSIDDIDMRRVAIPEAEPASQPPPPSYPPPPFPVTSPPPSPPPYAAPEYDVIADDRSVPLDVAW